MAVGLYVQRLSNGEIFNVQVQDEQGLNSWTLTEQEYVQRGCHPEIETLPDLENYVRQE